MLDSPIEFKILKTHNYNIDNNPAETVAIVKEGPFGRRRRYIYNYSIVTCALLGQSLLIVFGSKKQLVYVSGSW